MAPLRVMTDEKFLERVRKQGFRPRPRKYVHGDPILRRGPSASSQNGRFPGAPRLMETVYVTETGHPPTPGDTIAGTGIILAAATLGSRHVHSPGHRTGVQNWFSFFRNNDGTTPSRISFTANAARPALQCMPEGSIILDIVPWPIDHPFNRLPAPNSVPYFGRVDFIETFMVLYGSGFTALHVGYAGGFDEINRGLREMEEFKVEEYEIQAPTCKLRVAVVSRSGGHLCVLFRSYHGVFLKDLEIAKQWAEAVGLIVKLAGGQPAVTTMELAHLLVSNSGGRTAGKAAVAPRGGSAAAQCKAASTALGRGKSPARGESTTAAALGRGTPPAQRELLAAAAVGRTKSPARGESTTATAPGLGTPPARGELLAAAAVGRTKSPALRESTAAAALGQGTQRTRCELLAAAAVFRGSPLAQGESTAAAGAGVAVAAEGGG
jgi:hypothetical protein